MPSVSISPVFNGFQFFDNNGEPLNGGKLFQYEGGSNSIQQTTYADNAGTVPNPNPIVLDSSGRIVTDIWLENGLAYNLVLTLSDGTTVIDQVDNVIGVQASTQGGGGNAVQLWNGVIDVPNFISATSFSLPGNYAVEFAVSNRVKAELNTGVFRYGTVISVTVSGGNTIVTVVLDSGSLSGLLSAVSWSSNVSTGKTVDAGAVSFNVPTVYNDANTVGYQLVNIANVGTILANKFVSSQKVWTTSGTNAYTLTTTPAITSYTNDAIWLVRFGNATTGSPVTLNIDGVGAADLLAYNTSGVGYYPTIVAGQLSQVAYNGAQFILLDPLQIAGSNLVQRWAWYNSPGNYVWVVPAGVYSIRVTLAGGGAGSSQISINQGVIYGTQTCQGGNGGCGTGTLDVIPGQQYAVVVGAAGAAGADSAFGPIYYPAQGGAGGTSSFGGGLFVATGGQPGNQYTGEPGTAGTTSGSSQPIEYLNPNWAPVFNVPGLQPSVGYGIGGRASGTGWYPGFYPNPNVSNYPVGEPGGSGVVVIEWLQPQ